MSPPSSGSKNESSKKPVYFVLFYGFFLGLFFDPEDGSDIFLRNVS
jgi:hypothetical protein